MDAHDGQAAGGHGDPTPAAGRRSPATGGGTRRRPVPSAAVVRAGRAGLVTASVVAAVVAAAGCRSGPPATALAGRVTQTPCGRPVIEGEPPCPDPPVAGEVEVRGEDGAVVAHAPTDAQGAYRLRLPPVSARYTVTIGLGDPPPRWPQCPTLTVDVTRGEQHRLDISCQSGMR